MGKTTKLSDVFMIVGGMVIVFCAMLGIAVIVIELTLEEYMPPPARLCEPAKSISCDPDTYYKLVETIPYGDFNQTLPSPFQDTSTAWIEMIQSANSSIQIACSYITLNQTEDYTTDPWTEWGHDVGVQIYNLLIDAHDRGVKIQIVENDPPSPDSKKLQEMGVAEVRAVNVTELIGSGILHAKFFVVDNSTFYLGSANMDWRSLTQVKELGIVVTGSHCLSTDLLQIFDLYWNLATLTELPSSEKETSITNAIYIPECNEIARYVEAYETNVTTWPFTYQAFFNQSHPAKVDLILDGTAPITPSQNQTSVPQTFITSSPQEFCGPFRTSDIDATLDLINKETKKLCICVMYYAPLTLYGPETQYWSVLDSALRTAAVERNVKVQLMVSQWNYTVEENNQYLLALDVLTNISVKFFEIPAIPGVDIPHSRTNHAKYLVTSTSTSITTSNWSADYFLSTGGVSYITDDAAITAQVQWSFDRDWNSNYTTPIAHC